MKTKLFPYVSAPVRITGGWSLWYPKPSHEHLAYDMVGDNPNDKYTVYAGMSGEIVKPTSIPIYSKKPWLDDYGFALKIDTINSPKYILYNHCIAALKQGSKVSRTDAIGKIDTLARQRALRKQWGANPNTFTARHLHVELINETGKLQVNPLDYMRRVSLTGLYTKKQYRDNKDLYVNLDEEAMYKQKYEEEVKKNKQLKKDKNKLQTKLTQIIQKAAQCALDLTGYKKKDNLYSKTIGSLKSNLGDAQEKIKRQSVALTAKDKKIENKNKEITELEQDLESCRAGEKQSWLQKFFSLFK